MTVPDRVALRDSTREVRKLFAPSCVCVMKSLMRVPAEILQAAKDGLKRPSWRMLPHYWQQRWPLMLRI